MILMIHDYKLRLCNDFNDFSDYGELLLCPDLSSNVTRYRCKKGIVNLA